MGRRWLGLALAAALLPSCGGGGGGGGGGISDTFDRQALLTNLATNLVLPTYQALLTKVQALKAAVDAHAADLPDAGKKTAAQQAWREAMDVVEVAELFQFGPAGSSLDIAGGLDLRLLIYAWPPFSACLTDQRLVSPAYNPDAAYFASAPINVKSLAALEYLLFYAGPDDACSPPIGADWTALAAQIPQRRADYAAGACAFVLLRVQDLVDAWSAGGGNFVGKFNAAASSGVYASAHAAVNDVFGAMFYLDTVVKDRKLAAPAGLSGGAPEALLCEAPHAVYSKESLLKNLETFQILFLGNAPGDPAAIGFDDFLVARGAPALAASMTADIAEAIVAANAIPVSIEAAVQDPMTGLPLVTAAHAAIRDVTDALKTQFVSVLGLTVPATGAGDTD